MKFRIAKKIICSHKASMKRYERLRPTHIEQFVDEDTGDIIDVSVHDSWLTIDTVARAEKVYTHHHNKGKKK